MAGDETEPSEADLEPSEADSAAVSDGTTDAEERTTDAEERTTDDGPPADGTGRRRVRSSFTRRGVERTGLVLTGALAVAMLAFLLVEWLRGYPLAGSSDSVAAFYRATGIDPLAERLFEQFVLAGHWLDYYLGTAFFRFEFYWRSIATGVLVGIAAPLVGLFLVHREMALVGETLAHTAFAGIAFGLVLVGVTGFDPPLLLVALVVGVVGALCVQWLADRTATYGDVPIAIMLVGSFAVGTIAIEVARRTGTVAVDVEAYLFGNVTVVPIGGARLMALLTVAVVTTVAATYKQLLFITFDEQAARVAQLPVGRYNTLLVVLTAVVVVGSLQILGVILVAGMLVVPVAAASQLARGFRETCSLSILFGEASILLGFAVAFSLDLPAGGSIVVVATALYVLSIAASSRTTAVSTR